jgi:hypothetical protein
MMASQVVEALDAAIADGRHTTEFRDGMLQAHFDNLRELQAHIRELQQWVDAARRSVAGTLKAAFWFAVISIVVIVVVFIWLSH